MPDNRSDEVRMEANARLINAMAPAFLEVLEQIETNGGFTYENEDGKRTWLHNWTFRELCHIRNILNDVINECKEV